MGVEAYGFARGVDDLLRDGEVRQMEREEGVAKGETGHHRFITHSVGTASERLAPFQPIMDGETVGQRFHKFNEEPRGDGKDGSCQTTQNSLHDGLRY